MNTNAGYIIRCEWHGNTFLVALMFLSGILIPRAVIYFTKNLAGIQPQFKNAEAFAEFPKNKK